jgi:hypothetical protein
MVESSTYLSFQGGARGKCDSKRDGRKNNEMTTPPVIPLSLHLHQGINHTLEPAAHQTKLKSVAMRITPFFPLKPLAPRSSLALALR